jgi:hypothetical protein
MEGVKGGEGECPQTLETRAPEVWKGLGAWPSSDVWSVGVTVCPSFPHTAAPRSWPDC